MASKLVLYWNPLTLINFGSNLEGDAVDFTKYLCTSLLIKMQCASQKPSSKCEHIITYFASNFLGLIWRGARWILQNACAGVCYYKIYKMQRASQKPSSKCEHIVTYFASNFLGLIWRGARWVLQNACARVYHYKMQCASQKSSSKCKTMFFIVF